MSLQPDESGSSSPESLFAKWLARRELGEGVDIAELFRAHPEHSNVLRELHVQYDRIERVRRQVGLVGTLSERLQSHFGGDLDPRVSLQGCPIAGSDYSTEVLSRLAGRGPASERYRLQGEIAHGGMGAILRVWDEDLRRHLAMKVVLGRGGPSEKGSTPPIDRRLLARFLEEAQVTGQLDHPGIVPVHELGLDGEGRVYFTMKLVEGTHFGEVLELAREGREGWTQIRALGVIQKVCDAMAYAHSRGVVHRDLKPANVMVGRFGEVYVMDWGLARILARGSAGNAAVESERESARELDPASSLHTQQGAVMGTPAYMPPEQALGRIDEIGPAADVYAAGAMLYHLMAGHPPYVSRGRAQDHGEIWQRVKAGSPETLSAEARTAPPELVAICERAMAREVDRRYPDMKALAADLAAYVEGRVVRAYEAGAWAEARKWVRRNRPMAASLAAALVFAIGGLTSTIYVQAVGREAERVQRERAEESELQARDQAAKVLRLSDVRVLEELEAAADRLGPAFPENIPAFRSWLQRARSLAERLPAHRATLLEMRAFAEPWTGEEREHDRSTHPSAQPLAEKRTELETLIAQLESDSSDVAQGQAEAHVEELEAEIARLSDEVQSRRTWRFEAPELQWQHDVLEQLIGDLEGLLSGLLAADAIVPDHGWSVPKRLAHAERLESGFAQGGEYASAWAEALPRIHEVYAGLDLKPQMGLVPIGEDPSSGLWEFAHLMTGTSAARGPEGKLIRTEESGLVLVLLRGGTFWMGAQSDDPGGENYDPQSLSERPVHEVELSPFFMSKYEMTQGQWLRAIGRNPSRYNPETNVGGKRVNLMHPVEQVSWTSCLKTLGQLGLSLPSEALWEYAARGGTSSPWCTGEDPRSLQDAANLADRFAMQNGGPSTWQYEQGLDDGYVVHAPTGSFAANAFGLHDVAGNVFEWCLDGFYGGAYEQPTIKDPVFPFADTTDRVNRGGCFGAPAAGARSAFRNVNSPVFTGSTHGLRPARWITK